MMSESELPSASMENKSLRLEYLTTTGPRIIGLYTKNMPRNLLAETPDLHWETPQGEFYLRGGHRLWIAPENPFYICPEEGLNVTEENDCVTLKSPVDASGFQKEITIQLDGNCVHLSHRVTWCGKGSIELAPWSITQLQLGGIAILPLSQKAGVSPDRNIVLWPYSQVRDVRFDLLDDMLLLYGRTLEHAFKVGNYNSHGWIAYALGNVLFVKRFATQQAGRYPDLGCNVEAYVKDVCVELEVLGTLATLNTNESVTFEETWEILTGEYSTTLENVRKIRRQLSQS